MNEPKTILIIDDDPDYVASLACLFESAGHQVVTAPDGRRGYDVALASTPDLILLDVMMAERTEGFFTLDRIRATRSLADTPVIIVSSIYAEYPSFRVDPRAGWLPADLFLAKPVDPARLLEEAARLMSRSRSQPGSAVS